MRIVFLGSGAFGLPTLEALAAQHEIVQVVSQCDKPAGRGKTLTPTPIAAYALTRGFALERPIDINAEDVRQRLRALDADAWVVIAFGQKLSAPLLDGVFAINLHGSLLPAYRGAAPIQRAVMDGCAQTGVSVIALAERMDAGVVYATRAMEIAGDRTSDDVHDALSLLGPEVVLDVLQRQQRGELHGIVQDEAQATRARKLSKVDAQADIAQLSARAAAARINGLNSWPGCVARVGALTVKLLRVRAMPALVGSETSASTSSFTPAVAPGELTREGQIGAADGTIAVLEIQVLGGRPMAMAEFLRGRPQLVGEIVHPGASATSS